MNKQIMSLRDLKVSIIDEIKCLVQELKSIQAALDLSEQLPLPPIPQLHPDEVPEKKFQFDSDILLKFKHEQEAKAKLQEQLEGSPSFGVFRERFLHGPSLRETEPVTRAASVRSMKIVSSVVTEQPKVFEIEKAEPTETELAQMKDRKYEIAKLQDCEESLYATFQASLGENNKFARFLTKVLKKKIKRTCLSVKSSFNPKVDEFYCSVLSVQSC